MAAPSAVFTIARVAAMLGEDEDWLSEVALEMDPEDGRLAVYGINDEATTGFTSFGSRTSKSSSRYKKTIRQSSSAIPVTERKRRGTDRRGLHRMDTNYSTLIDNMTVCVPTPRRRVSMSFRITAMSEYQAVGRVVLTSTP
jgi:hypothetical protein